MGECHEGYQGGYSQFTLQLIYRARIDLRSGHSHLEEETTLSLNRARCFWS